MNVLSVYPVITQTKLLSLIINEQAKTANDNILVLFKFDLRNTCN